MILSIPGSCTDPKNWIIQSCVRAWEFVENQKHMPRTGTSGATDANILRNRGILRAVWRLWWLYRGALTALPYDTREPIDPSRFAHECRRREALGYVTGLVRALPRVADLRRDMAA